MHWNAGRQPTSVMSCSLYHRLDSRCSLLPYVFCLCCLASSVKTPEDLRQWKFSHFQCQLSSAHLWILHSFYRWLLFTWQWQSKPLLARSLWTMQVNLLLDTYWFEYSWMWSHPVALQHKSTQFVKVSHKTRHAAAPYASCFVLSLWLTLDPLKENMIVAKLEFSIIT